MILKKNGVFNQKELIKICIDRINTQDRDGRLPMRVINKVLNRSSFQKEWREIKVEFVKGTVLIANNTNTEIIKLSEVKMLEIKEQPGQVTFKDKKGNNHVLYSEVFKRGQNGGIYEAIETDDKKNITLDHSIPVSCIFELKHNEFQTIEEVNRQFDDYVYNNPEKSTSELAKDFTANNIDEHELFEEMKRLFKIGHLTIMERKSNVSKNNYFSYCSVDEWSNCPHFRKRHEELFK